MIDRATHYVTGQAMRAGDQILYTGDEVEGTILFVLNQAGCVSGHEEMKTWLESQEERGFMFSCESQGLTFCDESDEDFVWVQRQADG